MKTVNRKSISKVVQFWPTFVKALILIAVIFAVIYPHSAAVALIPLVPLIIIVHRQRKVLLRRPRGVGGITRYGLARYMLIGTAAVHLFVAETWTWAWVIVLIIAAALVEAEKRIRSLNGVAVPYAQSLPGVEARNAASFPYGILFPLDVLLVAAVAIAPLLPSWAAYVLLAYSLVPIGVALASLVDITRRVTARREFRRDMGTILEDMAPVFYLYWHAQAGSVFQVTMWLPYLERLGVPYAVVVRTVGNFREVARATDAPVVLCRTMADLEPLMVPSVRGVFYVNNAMRNNHMVRYSHLTHVQLLHGESDKAASYNPVTRMFDYDFVAGQAAIDRFAAHNIPMREDIFRIVGRPQVEDVAPARGPIGALSAPTVLYAPTWLGFHLDTQYTSLAVGHQIVAGLLERGCTVVFRPHPYSYRSGSLRRACRRIKAMLAADAEQAGRQHLFGFAAEKEMSVFDCFNASDAMVSDVSSVVGDYLHSGKPFAMVAVHSSAEAFVHEFPTSRAAYILEAARAQVDHVGDEPAEAVGADESAAPASDADTAPPAQSADPSTIQGDPRPRGAMVVPRLDAVLTELLETDPKRRERLQLADYYLGDIPRDGYSERFLDVAREVLHLGESPSALEAVDTEVEGADVDEEPADALEDAEVMAEE
ncbi:CDP-glycerol glycerophosphotransferase family protein [Brachybacterium halotolerans subsp. kimchii]|uniref:CDP-glycerol glycerophosphotransferase family protein n=1 Tax=Brachybacterium halotolerans TaxID=2795215 RepID=UPI001E48B844|nr:CDP-glycerol glycerophosphotransferase family protein [Brachybacterium halotolerans]UEJ84155.1 CDP-glycerol glycerophosphotransferase family protein [Brachybacterium halotolerans subsp. kimchii]